MVKNHIKRINAPKRWDILRKEHIFVSRPNPGRDFSLCLPLNLVLKEMLHKTTNTKESKYMIKNQSVLVNGKKVYDEKFPVGFLDVINFPILQENYRFLVNDGDELFLLRINEEEAKLKLSKVLNKKTLPGGKLQVNCTDGRNFLFAANDSKFREVNANDSILYTLPEQQIKQFIKLEKGDLVYLYKGKHVGQIVAVDDFKGENISFKINKDVFETKKAYAFVIGKEKPVITVIPTVISEPKATKQSKTADKAEKAEKAKR